MKTPLIFLIFNRPDTTKKVFEAIRHAKPKKLLVVADGPRSDRPEEAEKCQQTRAIIDLVDWDCEVVTNFADTNLGTKQRISSGLNWAFELVEEAIILEDDCLPDASFFPFCEELLEYYRHDDRVGMICGQNFLFGRKRTDWSYYFSRYHYSWGWATWRRAWQHFDTDMKLWPTIRDGKWLEDIFGDRQAVRYWHLLLDATYENEINTWDYQWMLSIWLQNYLTVVPNVNLISNVGFGEQATRTKEKDSKYANMPVENMATPLKHPPFVIRDRLADNYIQKTLFKDFSPTVYFKNAIKKLLRSKK